MDQEPSSTLAAAEQYLTISDGRVFQNTNDAYILPTDSGEHSRLDLQHELVWLMVGGELYQTPELVRATLSPQENTKRRILDVGSGSGKWAIDMAQEFPHADVLGIDLVQPNVLSDPTRRVPPNCSFQIADANKDMEKIDSAYDLVHLRLVEAGIDDSDLFFYDAARVLRPGGLLLLVGADPLTTAVLQKLVDEKGKYIPLQKPGHVEYSYYQHLMSCLSEVLMKLGPLRTRHPFWRSMLENNPNYSNVQIKELLIPPGPWSNDLNETERKLAEVMQANLLRLFPAFKASLLRNKDFSEEFVNRLTEGAMKEVRELPPAVHRYKKWVFATAVRNEYVWTARKGLWQEPPGFDIYDYVVRPLPKE